MAVNNFGRPTKFTQEEISKYAKELREWCKDPTHWWFKDFCLDQNINPDLMSIWAKENTDFSGALEEAKHRQESRILSGSLMGNYNSKIATLILTNKHNWSEKTETKVTGDSTNPLHAIIGITSGKTKDLVDDEDDGEETE